MTTTTNALKCGHNGCPTKPTPSLRTPGKPTDLAFCGDHQGEARRVAPAATRLQPAAAPVVAPMFAGDKSTAKREALMGSLVEALIPAETRVIVAGTHNGARPPWPVYYDDNTFPGMARPGSASGCGIITPVTRIAPATAELPTPGEVAAAVKSGIVRVAKPTTGYPYQRAMWDVRVAGDRVGSYTTKRDAMTMVPAAMAVAAWHAPLADIPTEHLGAAAQIAQEYGSPAELVVAVAALYADPADTAS